MSFVSIPALIGPMLGPVVGGFIVGYFHWRMIFFVNLPIGLLGLYLVYRHLPDYREREVDPLDVTGLVLFGSGIGAALVRAGGLRRAHARPPRRSSASWLSPSSFSPSTSGTPSAIPHPLLRLDLFRIRTFRSAVARQLHHAPRRGRHAVSSPAALPGRPRVLAGPVRAAHDAAVARGDGPQDDHADHPDALRLPRPCCSATRFSSGCHDRALRDDRPRHAPVGHRAPGVLLRLLRRRSSTRA